MTIQLIDIVFQNDRYYLLLMIIMHWKLVQIQMSGMFLPMMNIYVT